MKEALKQGNAREIYDKIQKLRHNLHNNEEETE